MASERLKRAGSIDLEELKLDMSPMIDMVFLLLIFFMVSAVMIDYRKDKDIEIPIAEFAKVPEDVSGRVVINIYNDEFAEKKGGRYADEASNPLDEEGVRKHIEKIRKLNENSNIKTRLHIRGDSRVDVEYTKRAVKAAAEAGVIDVIFSTYQVL